ncbi:hypothetical protein, partial [Deinococcus wulumuqiensis]
ASARIESETTRFNRNPYDPSTQRAAPGRIFSTGGVDRWQSPRFPFPAWNHKKAVQQLENAEQQGSFFVSESYPQ